MKKESYLFFIFLMAAAVVTGSTCGILSNIKHVSDYVQSPSVSIEGTVESAALNQNISYSSSTEQADLDAQNDNLMLSMQDQQEVNVMLNNLLENEDRGFYDRLKSFQAKNSLETTGMLDVQTLSILIQQAKLDRIDQLLP